MKNPKKYSIEPPHICNTCFDTKKIFNGTDYIDCPKCTNNGNSKISRNRGHDISAK